MALKTTIIISIVATIIGIMIFFDPSSFRWIGNQDGYSPIQPIAFSHRIHAGINKIPCIYCHFAAEKGAVAGIPPAGVCMNCHKEIKKNLPEIQKIFKAISDNKPIEWVSIYDLPDFTMFNHSRHVNASVKCQDCHGPVETMERVRQVGNLRMGWCISCHRKFRIVGYRGQEIQSVGKGLQASTDCSICHY